MARPRVAVLATTWTPNSHADVLGGRILRGYTWAGRQAEARIEIAGVYVDQWPAEPSAEQWQIELTHQLAQHGGQRYESVAEGLGAARGGVDVDGVLIIAEHGDYELNEYGQKLYPRRRLFDAAVSAMIAADRFVPIFVDKHLAWSYADAHAMYTTAQRLGVPLLAGSAVPLAPRRPGGSTLTLGSAITRAVALCHGGVEGYGFHGLEALQELVERRHGGESGVARVRALTGPDAQLASERGLIDRPTAHAALAACGYPDADLVTANVFLLEYRDGLEAAVVNWADGPPVFAAAGRGPGTTVAYQSVLDGRPDFAHFTHLLRQIETLMLTGEAPYPVERTLLTTGILAAAMRSRAAAGRPVETPELAISYRPAEEVTDVGAVGPAVAVGGEAEALTNDAHAGNTRY